MIMYGLFDKAGKLIAACPVLRTAGALMAGGTEPWEIRQFEFPDPGRGPQLPNNTDWRNK